MKILEARCFDDQRKDKERYDMSGMSGLLILLAMILAIPLSPQSKHDANIPSRPIFTGGGQPQVSPPDRGHCYTAV